MIIRIHKEGRKIIFWTAVTSVALSLLADVFFPGIVSGVITFFTVFFLAVVMFFRNPKRELMLPDDSRIYAPADGKIVAIEEIEEEEYFKERRLLVSIFMSPANVHVNRNPVGGKVNYFKYHPGKYLVAWHPKSSEENERTTIVIDTGEVEILCRQIAGAMAKRIVNYLSMGEEVVQGQDMGFIKFGSRVDLILPLQAVVEVELGQKVKGNRSIIARLP